MIETDIVVGAELRITCAKDELARALGVVARALSTRSSVQILSGILLEAIVPSRALQELARIPGDGDEIAVGVQENQVLFSTGGVWLTTRRIDGQFPNYRQLLPETFEHELTISRVELLDVVRRAAVMIQRATPLQLRFADGEVTVVARAHEVDE